MLTNIHYRIIHTHTVYTHIYCISIHIYIFISRLTVPHLWGPWMGPDPQVKYHWTALLFKAIVYMFIVLCAVQGSVILNIWILIMNCVTNLSACTKHMGQGLNSSLKCGSQIGLLALQVGLVSLLVGLTSPPPVSLHESTDNGVTVFQVNLEWVKSIRTTELSNVFLQLCINPQSCALYQNHPAAEAFIIQSIWLHSCCVWTNKEQSCEEGRLVYGRNSDRFVVWSRNSLGKYACAENSFHLFKLGPQFTLWHRDRICEADSSWAFIWNMLMKIGFVMGAPRIRPQS